MARYDHAPTNDEFVFGRPLRAEALRRKINDFDEIKTFDVRSPAPLIAIAKALRHGVQCYSAAART